MGVKPLRVGFTGSRGMPTAVQDAMLLKVLTHLRYVMGYDWMDNGDCEGSDVAAANHWLSLGGMLHLYPCNLRSQRAFMKGHQIEHPEHPLVRNATIVATCNTLVATPSTMTEVLRSGTWATIRRARKAHRSCIIIFPDGTTKAQMRY